MKTSSGSSPRRAASDAPLPFDLSAFLRHSNHQPPVIKPSTINHQLSTSQTGIALVIVMISIFVLTMLAGGFAYSMKVETKLARNAYSEAELE